MDRLRLSDLRVPIAEVLNVCASSSEVVTTVNRVERRLMRLKGGKWLGTVQPYRICTTSTGCLVWPRPIETIEAYWTCEFPGTIRNGWYEASQQGPGRQRACGSGCSNALIDRGTMATFDTPSNNTSKVAVTAEVDEEADARILIRGYDGAGNWIRTEEPAASGLYIDGEWVEIENGVTHYSVNVFSAITGAIKPITNGPVKGFQFDVPTSLIVKQLFYYEPTEEVPLYRASLIPGLEGRRGSGVSPSCCPAGTVQLTVQAKLRHIDVVDDNDFLVLGNEAAFALGAQALLKERRNLWTEAQQYWASAERELQGELSSFEGDGAIPTYKTEGSQSWGAGVQNALSLGWPITW